MLKDLKDAKDIIDIHPLLDSELSRQDCCSVKGLCKPINDRCAQSLIFWLPQMTQEAH